jgi:hypothetical protein
MKALKQERKMQVTFWNQLAGRRGVLLDNLTQEEAKVVAAKFSNPADKFSYLPDVQIETETEQERAEAWHRTYYPVLAE